MMDDSSHLNLNAYKKKRWLSMIFLDSKTWDFINKSTNLNEPLQA